MPQEVKMWISLCCSDEVEYSQVPVDDFDFIVERRGFTPRIKQNLKIILQQIGIGDNLTGEENEI